MEYDLELERAKAEIQKSKARQVIIQLPDGLKPKANFIRKSLESTGARIMIWMPGCYGACDYPIGLESLGFDMLIQWGHCAYRK